MQIDDTAVTEQELRQAYKDARLWCQGMTFGQAKSKVLVYWGLVRQAKAARKSAERYRQQHLQPRLI